MVELISAFSKIESSQYVVARRDDANSDSQ